MANPLTPDVLVDPVVLTRALVDVESESRNEKVIADCVEEVLRSASHLSVSRHGNTVMARTDLGREQRVVLAGHLDTVPINNNFPSTVVDDLIYGCGTSDMKSGVALALHLAATLPDPGYDVTYLFYEAEEIEHQYNGLGQGRRQVQGEGDAGLHVGRTAAVDQVVDHSRREVVVERDRVQVPGEHDPLRTAELRTGHDRVAVPLGVQVRRLPQDFLDAVGDGLLVAGDGLDVDQGAGKHHRIDEHVGG